MVCPWCFIGKRRCERAFALLDELPEPPRWLPFELHPEMPSAGVDRRAYLERKFGRGTAARFAEEIKGIGESEGIEFDFEKMRVLPNTFEAHRLALLGEHEGIQNAVIEEIFRRYFERGEDIGSRSVLLDIGGAVGLGAPAAERWLKGEYGAAEVRSLEAWVREREISMVPTFLINDVVAIVGAETPEEIARAISGPVTTGVSA